MEIPISVDWRDFYDPEEMTGSVAFQPLRELLVAFEGTYAKWSDYNVPYSETPPGDPMQDIFVPRVGVEVAPTDFWRFQLGYYYQPSAVRNNQPFTRFLDTDKHVFSCATEVSARLPLLKRVFADPLRFGVSFQYQALSRNTLNTVTGPATVSGYMLNIGANVQMVF